MATFHICEACRRAYKVFFKGARGAYLTLSKASACNKPTHKNTGSASVKPCPVGRAEQIARSRS
jgi:hypothetical protein